MQIAICDDDKLWAGSAQHQMEDYLSKTGIGATILLFFTPEKLLSYQGLPLDAVFLDIKFGKNAPNGIDIAKKINAIWPHCQIVFVTNYISYAMDAYESRHSYFAVKEKFSERLGTIFEHILYNQKQHRKNLCFVCVGQEMLQLAPDEIYYFERSNRKTYISTVWGTYEIYERIDDLCRRLPAEDFARCHHSFLVYIPAIRKIKDGAFCLSDGHAITISRKYQKTAKQAFTRYVLSQVR